MTPWADPPEARSAANSTVGRQLNRRALPEVDDDHAAIGFLVRMFGASAPFERKLQPGLLGLVLALFFLSLPDLLDDERR